MHTLQSTKHACVDDGENPTAFLGAQGDEDIFEGSTKVMGVF